MRVTTLQLMSFVLSVLVLIVGPLLVLMVKSAVRWTRVQVQVEQMAKDLKTIAEAKEHAHLLLMQQASEDRVATDRRLRWLEETLWREGPRNVRTGT